MSQSEIYSFDDAALAGITFPYDMTPEVGIRKQFEVDLELRKQISVSAWSGRADDFRSRSLSRS